MDFAPIYLAQRFFYRIGEFFHHWYVDGSRAIGRKFMLALSIADQSFAIKVTLHHFFEPLYKDYSVIGRILGLSRGSASVIPDEGQNLGWAHVENPLRRWERRDGPKRRLVEAFCVALYAGGEAERLTVAARDVECRTDDQQ